MTATQQTAAPGYDAAQRALRGVLPGAILCATIALAAAFVSDHYGGPVMLYALLIGMAFNHLSDSGACPRGVDFVSRSVLRVGVALLGARITIAQIAALGAGPITLVIVALLSTLLVGWLIARALGLRADFGVLTGGAVAICGASAALTLSAVLPRHDDSERHTIVTVVGVTALSTLAMVVYPIVAALCGLDLAKTGVFLGGTIHDVAQVVGAGYTVSPQTGDVSTVVKLTRVALLVPVALGVALCFRRQGAAAARTGRFPMFLVGFIVLMLANSFGFVGSKLSATLADLSRGCLVAAIAALGVKTSFAKLAGLGIKPIVMLVAETMWLATVVMTGVVLLPA